MRCSFMLQTRVNILLMNGISDVLRNVSLLRPLNCLQRLTTSEEEKEISICVGNEAARIDPEISGVRSKCPRYNDPPDELRKECNSWQTTRRTFPAPFSSVPGAGVFPPVSSFFLIRREEDWHSKTKMINELFWIEMNHFIAPVLLGSVCYC